MLKKTFLQILQNLQKNACAGASFLKKLQLACIFISKYTLPQVLFCKFCKMFKNTYFEELDESEELGKNIVWSKSVYNWLKCLGLH